MTTTEIKKLYDTLNTAKLTRMECADKFKLIKALRQMKSTVTAFEDYLNDVREKLKGDNHDAIMAKAQKWQREGDKTTLSEEERIEVNRYLLDYNRQVGECIKEEAEKDVPISFDKLSEEAFMKLVESNDWDAGVIMDLQDVLV